MDVVIVGGHGQIARLLAPLLTARGDHVRGIVRNPDHRADLKAAGVEPVVCDLERAGREEVRAAVAGADALVFAAGAGPGSGAARKLTMDRDGAAHTVAACEEEGVGRYVMVSAMGAADPPGGDDVFAVYLRAKADADAALASSSLRWTIVRPGHLTDDPPTGRVQAGPSVARGDITRADTAAVLAEVLAGDGLGGVTFEVVGGDVPVPVALDALAR